MVSRLKCLAFGFLRVNLLKRPDGCCNLNEIFLNIKELQVCSSVSVKRIWEMLDENS